MIYLSTAVLQSGSNWEGAYRQLCDRYFTLARDYQGALIQQQELQQKINKVQRQTLELREHGVKRDHQKSVNLTGPVLATIPANMKQITIGTCGKSWKALKKMSSAEIQSERSQLRYHCTYGGCEKAYSSPVSMNLHIKLKHKGGTKKERQAYAKMLLQASDRGEQLPHMDINLPPNFLEEFKTSYEYMKKYSM